MRELLACVDLSDATDAVVAEAAELAHGRGGRVHLLHVAADEPVIAGYDKDPISPYTRDDRAGELLDEHGQLRDLAARLEAEGLEVEPLVVMGATIDKILEVADRIDAGHLVVGSHGRSGLHHLLTGSVTEALLKRSTRPVVVVPVHHR
ncbi:MAG: universal stress protein [Acidimicrobiales bacterium]